MYGSYGMYSGNRANFSSATNLYRPAGVINIQASNTAQTGTVSGTGINLVNGKGTDGTIVGVSSTPHTSIMSTLTEYGTSSSALMTNTSYNAQHVDYEQNPSAVRITSTTQNSSQLLEYNTYTISLTLVQNNTSSGPPIQYLGSYRFNYVQGMTLPKVGGTVTVRGVLQQDGVTPYDGYNGTFTVFSVLTSPGIITLNCTSSLPTPAPAPSNPNSGTITFTQ